MRQYDARQQRALMTAATTMGMTVVAVMDMVERLTAAMDDTRLRAVELRDRIAEAVPEIEQPKYDRVDKPENPYANPAALAKRQNRRGHRHDRHY